MFLIWNHRRRSNATRFSNVMIQRQLTYSRADFTPLSDEQECEKPHLIIFSTS